MGSNALVHEGSFLEQDLSASLAFPIQQFFFFHKAIRADLERLCLDARVAGEGGRHELQLLRNRFELLRLIYAQHSNAEDEVIFPALDSRVKNIAPTYLLEHKDEDHLFDLMSELLSSAQRESNASLSKKLKRELLWCTEAIKTSLSKHMSKEEKQVFPLLLKHFNVEEQATLVWQFLCRIPVSLLQKLLPWIAASLSEVEHESMVTCMKAIIPKDDLLQNVVLTWLEMASTSQTDNVDIVEIAYNSQLSKRDASTSRKGSKRSAHNIDFEGASFEGCSKLPVSDLMFWHTSLGKEFMDFAEDTKRIQGSKMDHTEKLSFLCNKLKSLMEIRAFYSAAEDNILFPALLERANHSPSFVTEHTQEELQVRKFQSVLESMRDAGIGVVEGVVDAVCDQAARIAYNVQNHLKIEAAVFPLVQKFFSIQEQQTLFFESLRMLPLKVLEKVLPWFASILSDKDLKDMLQNIKHGGLADDEAFVSLLIGWATGGKHECSRQNEMPDHPSSGNLGERSVRRRFSIDTAAENLSLQSCCSLLSCSSSCPGSCLFGVDCMASSNISKPIDCIFQFHKAIQKDLEFLDQESERIPDCTDQFLEQFTERFTLLWGLYRAHSKAEDEIVFPALETREALHNVSHSYVIDHEKEEQLFKDISNVLTQLSALHTKIAAQGSSQNSEICHSYSSWCKQKLDLSLKLQGMCKSIQVSLNQHISREERELWPLFNEHFSVQEQEKIIGRIIGTTGAEVLQSMIRRVTAALSLEEQSSMFETWLFATRNTMFDRWLHSRFPSSPIRSPRILTPVMEESQSSPSQKDEMPQSGNTECLRMLAEYLAKDSCSGVPVEKVDESVECMVGTEGASCDAHFQEGKKLQTTETDYLSESSACQQTDYMDQHYSCSPDKRASQSQDEKGSAVFKAGWQDIFRMNQKELEAAVRKVSNDDSLDPRKKAYLMQHLMTSRWIVAQQRQPTVDEDGKEIPGCDPSFHDRDAEIFGCEHYKRNCKLLAACCGLLFTCRFCHDNVSDHTMDRQATKEIMCMKCLKIQPVAQHCSTPSCNNFQMARYYCSVCKFFDDDNKDIYHCPYCNICRVGKGLGIDYFHCMICNACMNVSLKTHKCREKGLESNCPICHDFMFTSKAPVKALSCGHFMHSACFQAFTNHHYTCPICCKSVGDMSVYFGMLDGLLAGEELPEEYKDRKQEILCNDCEQRGIAPFHWLYHKCAKCGSYNTRVL
ncbi:hypothetical protein GOP47_0000140 [Adiantum capillus-veneris]|uniref:Zinc finger protein n=1 Tax=Adiantum capillus-veneris TaxID=13818 RepID=A0A9D4VCH5_ADICA|nr:hypothetical protein GOP47_0000140 [Adiantum capillus-veneris]